MKDRGQYSIHVLNPLDITVKGSTGGGETNNHSRAQQRVCAHGLLEPQIRGLMNKNICFADNQ